MAEMEFSDRLNNSTFAKNEFSDRWNMITKFSDS